MQCITVKQPWATLLAAGLTQYLVRDWRTSHRGPLAIQAGGKFPRGNVELCCDPEFRAVLRRAGVDYAMELPTRAVVGSVRLADCLYVTRDSLTLFDPEDPAVRFGLIQPGSWAWVCTAHHALSRPVALPGRLGIYPIPNDLFAT